MKDDKESADFSENNKKSLSNSQLIKITPEILDKRALQRKRDFSQFQRESDFSVNSSGDALDVFQFPLPPDSNLIPELVEREQKNYCHTGRVLRRNKSDGSNSGKSSESYNDVQKISQPHSKPRRLLLPPAITPHSSLVTSSLAKNNYRARSSSLPLEPSGITKALVPKEMIPYYHNWKVILRNSSSNQLVLYNQQNHQLAIAPGREITKSPGPDSRFTCQLCHQRLPGFRLETDSKTSRDDHLAEAESVDSPIQAESDHRRASLSNSNMDFMDRNYFRCLAISHSQQDKRHLLKGESATPSDEVGSDTPHILSQAAFNQGYYKRFFKEEKKLGHGARGNVFLCQHILDDIQLGRYAVKKVAIGNNHTWLVRMLKEVHMLEKLRHPNIIDYKHAWIENHQPNLFAPVVPCLFILMECANGGNLEEYVLSRTRNSQSGIPNLEAMTPKQRALYNRRQNSNRRTELKTAYLRLEEILSLFLGICQGLAHLHRYAIVHRDIKPPNLLLSYKDINDTSEIPKILLSDFGECEDMCKLSSQIGRTGATGTMEFMAPELLKVSASGEFIGEHSPKADMWSLGMVLYYLCYSELPYRHLEDLDLLRDEILEFESPLEFPDDSSTPRIPAQFKRLITLLLSRDPLRRPSVDEILNRANDIDFQDLTPTHFHLSSIEPQNISSNDNTLTSISSELSSPIQSKADDPLLGQERVVSTNNAFICMLIAGLKISTLILPCYPFSAHLAAAIPLTSLALWGMQRDSENSQWVLLAIHFSFLLLMYFSMGTICGVP